MNETELYELQNEMRQLHQDLQRTQARLQQLMQRVKQSASNTTPAPDTTFFKTSYSAFSLENLIGLRLIHIAGIVVLVIGLSIGVKYAVDRQLISETVRIALAYAAGLLLYLLSWRLQKKYAAFSAILFSGAMASLYFTSYAAFVYYNLFSFAVAFLIMVLLTLFTVYQALRYNRQEIAVLGLVGAYGIPFLISSNAGRAELLFLYVAFINTAVVFLSFKKKWKSVAVLAQALTWILLFGWALTRFTPVQTRIAYGFAAFFFLLFYAHALLDNIVRRQPLQRSQVHQIFSTNAALYALIAIVYTTPPAAQYGLLNLFFSVFLATQAFACRFLNGEHYLKKGLALFSVALFLLFISNRWQGITVTLLWLLVAVVLFSVGIAVKAAWLRLSAMDAYRRHACQAGVFRQPSLFYLTKNHGLSHIGCTAACGWFFLSAF